MEIRNSACQMTIADILHEEGEPQEVIAQKVDRSQNAVWKELQPPHSW